MRRQTLTFHVSPFPLVCLTSCDSIFIAIFQIILSLTHTIISTVDLISVTMFIRQQREREQKESKETKSTKINIYRQCGEGCKKEELEHTFGKFCNFVYLFSLQFFWFFATSHGRGTRFLQLVRATFIETLSIDTHIAMYDSR